MKRICMLTVLLLTCAIFLGCAAHIHQVGSGAQGNNSTELRQWYVLWGLVPINNVDTHAMAGDAADYTIKTEQSALDVIINLFTTAVTVTSRTVTVTK